MDIFSVAVEIYRIYQHSKHITGIFLNDAASIMNKIGNADFNAATKCIRDAKNSNNPTMELRGAITLLKSSIEKLSDKNKTKVQASILIATYYKVLGEERNSTDYLNYAKEYFNTWIDKNSPVGMFSVGILRMGYVNYINCIDFKSEVRTFGIKWEGSPIIPSFMCSNPIIMNEELRIGCRNAKDSFNEKINHLFDNPIRYRLKCNHCHSITEHCEVMIENIDTIQLAYCKIMEYKIFKCLDCETQIIVDHQNKMICERNNFSNVTK